MKLINSLKSFALIALGLGLVSSASADQWVRFTITKKKSGGDMYNQNYVQLGKFALYSDDGTRQNDGLILDTEHAAEAIAPGSFHFNRSPGVEGNHPKHLFVADTSKRWLYVENSRLKDLEEGGTNYLVLTMHLGENAAPVVKYNLRSGGDTYSYPGRAPTCWRVETSDNGVDWVVRDEQDNEATSGYATGTNIAPCTWYAGGGSGDTPTTFYRLNPASPQQPSDYTRLDWIKSTRQQRIKTDYVPNARTWMEAELMLEGGFGHSLDYESRMFRSETGADGAMYSCHVASDQSEYHRFIIYRDATSGANVSMNINPIGNDATFLLRHAFRLENGLVTWGSESYTFGTTAKACANELYLFGSKDYNFKSYYMTVYSWKIYESDTGKKGGANETLVHDFVPALDPDGVPGLYDTVGHKFYPSITGTDFVYYQRGSLPTDYTRLEYIESTVDGQQYIDVPYVKYVNDGPTKITMRGMYTTSASDYQTLCGFTTEGFCCLGIKQGTDCVGNDSIGQDIKLAKNSLDTISWELDPLNSGNGAKKEWLAVNSAVNGEASDTGTSLLVLSGTNLTIFATYAKASHEMMYFSNYKLYAMTVEQGGVVVADFVPALNSEGVPGLYDLANGQFLTNDGSGEFGHKTAEQWFRLSITQKSGSGTGFMFSEFTLCDVAGNRQNYKLTEASEASNIGPGQFYHNKDDCVAWGDTKSEYAFDGILSLKLGHSLPWNLDSSGILKVPQVLVMHLTNGAPEVVKYNFCTANAQSCPGWSPVAWTLERSYDGQVWDVVDRRAAETSGFPGEVNNTWYKNGGTGSTPEAYFFFGDSGKDTTQWFRLTIQKKANKTGDPRSDKSLQLSEFALYDANGVRQNLNLSQGESAEGLWPGEFYYSSKVPVSFSGLPPHKLFDGKVSAEVDKMYIDYNTSDLSGLCDGDESCWQVLTMRLASGAPEVVKYNMCSGHDADSCKSRAPTAWTLEKSSDGVNWVVCDEQVEATSGYTTANSTWYKNGGTETTPTSYYSVSPVLPSANLALWFDASDREKLPIESSAGGTNFVTTWTKTGGTVEKMTANTTVSQWMTGRKPFLVTAPSGLTAISFGTCYNKNGDNDIDGYGASMAWSSKLTNIRDVFMVVADDPRTQKAQFLLTDSASDSYDFHRYQGGGSIPVTRGYFSPDNAAEVVKSGSVYCDGVKAAKTSDLMPPGFHVIRFTTTDNAMAGGLCNDRNQYSQGGLIYGEIMIYSQPLSDGDAAKVTAYLRDKWMGNAKYMVGRDIVGYGDGDSTASSFEQSVSSEVGWADAQCGTVDASHVVSPDCDYFVAAGMAIDKYDGLTATALLCTPDDRDATFAGRSLTLTGIGFEEGVDAGTLVLYGKADRNYTVTNLIAAGGMIAHYSDNRTMTLAGAIEIPDRERLSFRIAGNDNNAPRHMVVESDIRGGGEIALVGNGKGQANYVFSGNNSTFTGTVTVAPDYSPRAATIDFRGSFGGTVTSLPDDATAVKFNYDGLDSSKGVRVATTAIPVALKNKLTLYSSSADFTRANLPLITFPAGTEVDPSEFTVSHATGENVDGQRFSLLGVVTNSDETITLVANCGDVYHVINPETGPEIVVDPEWLQGAFKESATKEQYQQDLFTTNASGVVAWQSYVLGFGASEVSTAAILEETVQNANPETVTIRLRGMPETPRTNETARLAYSLYSARTPGGLLNGGGTAVRDLNDNQFERCEQSTFEAPLKDLTDEEPVNYYRIKVHFIFDK